ncbi:GPW/gp25 family protein [Motilimonas sp. 1_MG-2023]|uniref:GPW/gp25 family protein n=1 Tax=Motilimonas sp. 1_MG-2023 TaxID=3062672 RepID=UPI0026E12C12|nr:GPW/gp25 family protein [Motilimonas sp. 1_MG-2023]MDO6525438.1 GPW/gp25 family protein [Motilimonas sp. 1_MG-2023]
MTWSGMNRGNGREINDLSHIRQSIADILTTPIGTRIMRREYGSHISELIDQPQNGATRMKMMAATVMALLAWEPRVDVVQIDIAKSDAGAAEITVHGVVNGQNLAATVRLS